MAQPLVMSTAGKTSPRILEDLLRYDPRLEERAERNILASLPHRFDPQASTRKPAIPQGSCSHILILKADESVLPNTDTVAWEEGTRLKVATICSRCRYHFDLFVQHKRQGVGQPCGTGKGEPLHHFACRGISHGEYIDPTDLTADPRTPSSSTFDFICQFEQCQMVLKVLSRPPAILPEDYRLLMDGDRLDARHRAVLKEHRDVKPQPIPAMVLATLRVYIGNALNPDWLPRTIPFTHKTFLALFGTDTQTFLHRLGFTPTAEDHPDGLGRWIPPIPTDSEDVWRRPDKRTYLQDVYQELGIVLWDCKPHEREEVASRMEIYPLVTKVNAVSSIESILSCAGYEKKPGARATRSTRSDEEDHPHYASLGAVADFSDNLILFAWKTQSFFDKLDHAYYLDCLRGIAQGRGSEALSVEVALADSRGVYDRKTIDNAFRCLGIDPQKGPTLTGEQILNHYNVRYQDVGERTRMDMREMRKILAHVFDLQCLSDSSDELLDTYEACLRFLEADDSYSDEFIQVAYQTKVKTRDSSEDRKGEADREVTRARHALKIIAERRHSDALMAFVTAEIDDDDVTQAFNFFNIKERDGYIDPEMIDMYALTHQQDNPFNWNEIERHRKSLVRHIARKFPSGRRYSYLQSHSPESDPKDHPVGLRNIGNTCYLASVLQFLYSIRPFRDVILTFPGNVDDNVNVQSSQQSGNAPSVNSQRRGTPGGTWGNRWARRSRP
ncbi:UCH-domain-containing protein [Eremomyces bilateralis CBS 781.70]|uniref:ubiquitinyl hydrolase 1 n=1 Tax=Eremomyces bilateralis CBS 781.70 TaxID=1392243 RepID=A0A6G1GHV2_9PEZI|nr:UCH-domain-containing protein [Eremomyces bilateralis CBS 781.70]KAF1817658.1 UCH-domain-containing protein [Eremomyces bilateralis CBS 781.70]